MSFNQRKPVDVESLISVKIDNLTYKTNVDQLKRIFEKFGEIGDVYIPRDPYSKNKDTCRGFGFVRFYDYRDAEDAVDAMDRTMLDGREIKVQLAKHNRASRSDFTRNQSNRDHYRRSRSRSRSRRRYRSRSRDRQRRNRSRSRSRNRHRSRSHDRYRRSRSRDRRRSRSRNGKRKSLSKSIERNSKQRRTTPKLETDNALLKNNNGTTNSELGKTHKESLCESEDFNNNQETCEVKLGVDDDNAKPYTQNNSCDTIKEHYEADDSQKIDFNSKNNELSHESEGNINKEKSDDANDSLFDNETVNESNEKSDSETENCSEQKDHDNEGIQNDTHETNNGFFNIGESNPNISDNENVNNFDNTDNVDKCENIEMDHDNDFD